MLGPSARKNAGMPIVTADTSVRCRGRNGKGTAVSAAARIATRLIAFLATKRLATRSTLPMTRRPSASTSGRCENLPVEQDELGDGLGGLRAVAHGDADVGVLEGERVVDAVAGHRDDVAVGLQGVDEGALLLGGDAAEDRVRARGPRRSASWSSGRVRASTGSPTSSPTARATAATVTGLSPEMTLMATPCSAK